MSCCGNELVFNSVAREIVSSNLDQISYISIIVRDNWGFFGAGIIAAALVAVARRIGVKFLLRAG